VLEFKLVLNVGAVFGAGPGKRALFIGVTVFAVLFGVFLFGWWTGPRDRMAHVGIGLLLAGGLGNLYDRLVYACVRDFIHPLPGVRLPFGWRYPSGEDQVWPYVSNVADKWLLIGIAILLVHAWRMGGQEHKKGPATPPAP
jgi:signal peptidase II